MFYLLNNGQSKGQISNGQSKGVGGNKIVRTENWSLTKLLYHSQRVTVLIPCKRG